MPFGNGSMSAPISYSALVYKGGAGWREHLLRDIGDVSGLRELLDEYDDPALHALMTNLGGHDLETVLDAFHGVRGDRPTCFLAYTIKGYGLPFAGHKDNHAGLMTPDQMELFRKSQGVETGREWEALEGLPVAEDELREFLAAVPFAQPAERRHRPPVLRVPDPFPVPKGSKLSTQEGFGRLLADLARGGSALSERIVTASPDVTVSTNLGAWVNRRGVFDRRRQADVFRLEEVVSAQKWEASPEGQHIELGIAENNLFLLLAALGLAGPLFGVRLLPVGTLYDPFIARGLDALNYACYQDARFLLVATPSGITLAPEGGAHQSVSAPLIGIGQPGLVAYEPAFQDELAEIVRFALEYLQDENGGSVYLRLSTRPLAQPDRTLGPELRRGIVEGGYWLVPPEPGADLALAYTGVVAPEVQQAFAELREDARGAGLLAVTSADRLHAGWRAAQSARASGDAAARAPVETLLAPLRPRSRPGDGARRSPRGTSWLGAVLDTCRVARGRTIWSVWRHSGPLPRVWPLGRRDRRAGRSRVP